MSSVVETSVKKDQALVGQPLKRMEDPKFITGSGKYSDDFVFPNMLHGVFVRSLHAHARLARVDVGRASQHPGVRLALTGQQISPEVNMVATASWGQTKPTKRYPLAVGEVNFVGEPVALVVADDKATAEDAAELVEVEYDVLPAVVDMEAALQKGSPRVHDYLPDNVARQSSLSFGNVAKAFRDADHVVKARFEFPRLSAVPMEPRNMVASYDQSTESLTLWVGSQAAHDARDEIAEMLRLPDTKVRLISPDMGGGFGQKGGPGPEPAVVAFASMKLGKPVKWVESRRENLIASTHGRGQIQYVEAAVRKDGKVLGIKTRVICDNGAYTDWGAGMPQITVEMAPGVYDLPAYSAETVTVLTNKAPIGAYRGAGRPEATFLIERTMDVVARTLKFDPVKLREKNYVPKSKFPYTTAGGMTYDSGDYEMNLKKALELSGFEELRAEQREARAQGRLVGIGLINYVEVSGFGPGSPQTAAVSVTKSGGVTIISGSNPHGQGHWTPFAQIVADELGVDVASVAFQYGDTASLPFTTITAGSRSAAVGGTAVLLAARKVKEKMSRIAAKKLEVRPAKMVFREGKIYPAGSPGKAIGFTEVAQAAYDTDSLPEGMEPTLYEYCAWSPPANVYPFGTHVAMVEVDKETGAVKVLRYIAVDDVGKVLNPLIVEGQVQGGALQGISQALLEEMVFDENGQPLTATLADYLIPSTDTAPNVRSFRTETPSPVNPLGVKGVGEAGTIAGTPVIVSAVEDALTPYGAIVTKLPLSPANVWSLMHASKKQAAG